MRMKANDSTLKFILFITAILLMVIPYLFIYKHCVSRSTVIFGTLVTIKAISNDEVKAAAAIEDVFDTFRRLHKEMHPWRKGDNYDLNQQIKLAKTYYVNSIDLLYVINKAIDIERLSEGLFNAAIGNIVEAWGFHRDKDFGVIPSKHILNNYVKSRPSMLDLRIDGNSISSINKTVKIDLGGIAKGYALDKARKILKSHNIDNAIIYIGGNIMALGKHWSHPWRVGIVDPRSKCLMAYVDLRSGESIGSSGNYIRFFIAKDGHKYCHIINPITGMPVNNVFGVIVMSDDKENSGLYSDAMSKPLFIVDHSKWKAMAKHLGIKYAIRVDAKGVDISDDFKKRLIFLNNIR